MFDRTQAVTMTTMKQESTRMRVQTGPPTTGESCLTEHGNHAYCQPTESHNPSQNMTQMVKILKGQFSHYPTPATILYPYFKVDHLPP